jgi:hypothetical protein
MQSSLVLVCLAASLRQVINLPAQVTISCLINQISDLPPEQRRIPLATIAERTKLSIDGVEFLLMKALALHLIEGSIDQVRGRLCSAVLLLFANALD